MVVKLEHQLQNLLINTYIFGPDFHSRLNLQLPSIKYYSSYYYFTQSFCVQVSRYVFWSGGMEDQTSCAASLQLLEATLRLL